MKSQRNQRTFLVDAALRYIAGDVTGLETDQTASDRAAETNWWPCWLRPRCERGAAPGYTCRMDKEVETTSQSAPRFARPLLLLAAFVLAGAAPVMYVWRTAPMPAKENFIRPGPAFWAELERQEREARLNDFVWRERRPESQLEDQRRATR